MNRLNTYILIFFLIFTQSAQAGTTGKIAGKITDAQTGEALIGANVILVGTHLGTATSLDGNFTILNIPPGNYDLNILMIGYRNTTITDIRVEIDLTTIINFAMTIESIQGEEVVVISNRSPIQLDIASSQVNISRDMIDDLPVTTISGVIGLQAGVEGMSVRQGGTDELAVMLDGASMKDDRTGRPILGIPLSSVQEIMIQSGGFNAEYSDLQAGVINIVTREGDLSGYSFNMDIKYSPATPKHFGSSLYDPNSYFLRPYMDDEVCWTGTFDEEYTDLNGNFLWDSGEPFKDANDDGQFYKSTWDRHTQNQFPKFKGWIALSNDLLMDENPDNDLSPEGVQRLFMWQHRRQGDIIKPDYNIDFGFGGPVPTISGLLGNLRFYSSVRAEKNMYLIPLSRNAYQNWAWSTKFTSDITDYIKLQVNSFISRTTASSASENGNPSYFESLWGVAGIFGGTSQNESKIWTPQYYCLTDIDNDMVSAKISHMLNNKSFYEIQAEYSATKWHTYPDDTLNTVLGNEIFPGNDELWVNDAPYGFDWRLSPGINGFMMGAKSNSRDNTVTSHFNFRFDFTSQINQQHQLKSGVEYDSYVYKMNYGAINPALPSGRPWTEWSRYPYQYNAYIQDKIEAKGWIATVGLRAEYFNPNGEWYDVDPYNKTLFSNNYSPDEEESIPTTPVDGNLTWLPRLGISHPITTRSKLYFNYGHMRQKFLPDYLFGIRREYGNSMSNIGNPYMPMEKTVMFELGYDQAFFADYNIHAAAYYKDKSDQANSVSYRSADNNVNYSQYENNFYQDIRGLELEVRKRSGNWVTGFANYTYSVYTSGYFGVRSMYQNPSLQRQYESNVSVQAQYKPIPLPRVNFNIAFHTPHNFGPDVAGRLLLSKWTAAFTGYWKAGSYATYGNVSGVTNNVRWVDSYMINFKASKTAGFKKFNMTFICDIYNLFNFKFLSMSSIGDQYDYASDRSDYYDSLHFPKKVYKDLSELHLSGNDRLGDYRDPDVEFQAMEVVYSLSAVAKPSIIYYVDNIDQWIELDENGIAQEIDQKKIDKLLEKKAYIDNPNIVSLMFLNPRDIYFGIKVSYNL